MLTAIITLIVILLIIGLLDWVIMNHAPISPSIKTIIRFILILAGVVVLIKFLLKMFNVSLD